MLSALRFASLVFVLFVGSACAQEPEEFDHSRFYRAKVEIAAAIFSVAEPMKEKPDKVTFTTQLQQKLAELGNKYPIDFTVIVEEPKNPNLPEMISITLIGYEDEKGFIGWKFDTIFSEKMVFGFVIALQDRTIPKISWEDYYRYKVVK